jgi:5-(carboxyamino)imidazole ribonucleotide mutase
MGSASDHETMKQARDTLTEFGVEVIYQVASAHRAPDVVSEIARSAKKNGISLIIAGAGGAAHLPGVIAAQTTVPVIGVPISSADLKGLDSLLSIAQMPGGIPVACMAIGSAGAKNAALYAISVLALNDQELARKLDAYRAQQREKNLNSKFPD